MHTTDWRLSLFRHNKHSNNTKLYQNEHLITQILFVSSYEYIPLHDSQALPPIGASPLLFPFTTPLLLLITAGFGLLLKQTNIHMSYFHRSVTSILGNLLT